ncbi:hydrolase or metal-binding protein [Castellaniella sp.]|uniref:recombination directionality factor n=1 Tax=Castellaniella sp. TaxID=1955812 RepID=UPI003A914E8C
MLKGFAITPPIIGRISIDRVIEKNGKRLPEKDDQFTITTQVQNHDGWVLHPAHEAQLKCTQGAKLRTIQIMLPFNDPDLNLRAQYIQFDRQTGRPIATSDGTTCRRQTASGMETVSCAGREDCCLHQTDTKPYGRLYVKIGDDQDDLGTFIFRTTSYNSIRTLAARMRYYAAVSGGLLASLPLELKLRGKSTTQSYHTPIYYVDLVVRGGMTLCQAIEAARQIYADRKASGFDQAALDEASRLGFGNGSFEETEEDLPAVEEEFFPDPTDIQAARPSTRPTLQEVRTLTDKLAARVTETG